MNKNQERFKDHITNEELQGELGKRLRRFNSDEPNAAEAKHYASVAAKLLASIRIDTDACHQYGVKPLPRVRHFLGKDFMEHEEK